MKDIARKMKLEVILKSHPNDIYDYSDYFSDQNEFFFHQDISARHIPVEFFLQSEQIKYTVAVPSSSLPFAEVERLSVHVPKNRDLFRRKFLDQIPFLERLAIPVTYIWMVCARGTLWLRMEVRLISSERVDLPPRELSTRPLEFPQISLLTDRITPIYRGLPRKQSLEAKWLRPIWVGSAWRLERFVRICSKIPAGSILYVRYVWFVRWTLQNHGQSVVVVVGPRRWPE